MRKLQKYHRNVSPFKKCTYARDLFLEQHAKLTKLCPKNGLLCSLYLFFFSICHYEWIQFFFMAQYCSTRWVMQ